MLSWKSTSSVAALRCRHLGLSPTGHPIRNGKMTRLKTCVSLWGYLVFRTDACRCVRSSAPLDLFDLLSRPPTANTPLTVPPGPWPHFSLLGASMLARQHDAVKDAVSNTDVTALWRRNPIHVCASEDEESCPLLGLDPAVETLPDELPSTLEFGNVL